MCYFSFLSPSGVVPYVLSRDYFGTLYHREMTHPARGRGHHRQFLLRGSHGYMKGTVGVNRKWPTITPRFQITENKCVLWSSNSACCYQRSHVTKIYSLLGFTVTNIHIKLHQVLISSSLFCAERQTDRQTDEWTHTQRLPTRTLCFLNIDKINNRHTYRRLESRLLQIYIIHRQKVVIHNVSAYRN